MADRRPYIPEETALAPQKRQRKTTTSRQIQDEFMLSAIIITDNKRIALLQSKKNKKLQNENNNSSDSTAFDQTAALDQEPNYPGPAVSTPAISVKSGNQLSE